MTPTQYINQLRMERAAELLMHTDTSVTEISMEVGFKNVSYFIRLFNKNNLETPLQYRKKYQPHLIRERL